MFEEEVCRHMKLEAKPKFVSKVEQGCLPPCKPTLIISVKLGHEAFIDRVLGKRKANTHNLGQDICEFEY